MKTIEVTEKEVKAAFDVAKTEEMKNVLKALFCKDEEGKPNLDDYTTIKTYEDACEALSVEPIFNEPNPIMNLYGVEYEVEPHIIALMKLETISRALWGRTWKPEPDADGTKWYYYPLFALYTQSEIDNMDEEKRGGLLSADATYGAGAGFGCLYTNYRSSGATADDGFRLCQETSEKAEYFGKQFLELWAEYLKFGFEVGWRAKLKLKRDE